MLSSSSEDLQRKVTNGAENSEAQMEYKASDSEAYTQLERNYLERNDRYLRNNCEETPSNYDANKWTYCSRIANNVDIYV